MPLKLNSTGGGSVTLDVGSTASNYTVTLPATSGTLMPIASVTNNGVVYVNSSGLVTSGSGLVFDGSNLGLGVTPSAWSGFKAFEFGAGNALMSSSSGYGQLYLMNNAYYNGSAYIYKNTQASAMYQQNQGAHQFFTAPSGTAGNPITFTQAMTLDASGNLGVGLTALSNGRVNIQAGTSGTGNSLFLSNADGTYNPYIQFQHNGINGIKIVTSSSYGGTAGNLTISPYATCIFETVNTERMRIDSSGNVGIGTSSPAGKVDAFTNGYAAYVARSTSAGTNQTVDVLKATDSAVAYYANARYTANSHLWNIGGTEAARIDSSGNVSINTTAAGAKLVVGAAEGAAFTKWYNSSNGGYWTVRLQGDGSSSNNLHFDNSGLGDVMVLRSGGTIQTPYIGTNTGTAMVLDSSGYIRVSSSSRRYKENIEPIDVGLAEVMQMEPVKYDLIGSGTAQVGFIAEDFPEPRLVNYSMVDPADPSKGTQVESVNYANLTAILVKAVQELKAELDELKAKVNA